MKNMRKLLILVFLIFAISLAVSLFQHSASYSFLEIPVIGVLVVVGFVLLFAGQPKNAIDNTPAVKITSKIVTGFLIAVLVLIIIGFLIDKF